MKLDSVYGAFHNLWILVMEQVVDYIKRAEQASISWPISSDLDEWALGLLLFSTQPVTGQRRFAEPDFMDCFVALKKSKFVTRHLLRQVYRQQHPGDGYSYAQFCHRFKEWQSK